MSPRNSDKTIAKSSEGINRRDVVKAVGATTFGSAAFVGTASAWCLEVRFCGCGQCVVRVCDDGATDLTKGSFEVRMWKEGNGSNSGENYAHPDPENSGYFEFVQQGDGKIISLEITGIHKDVNGVYCNPNHCAETTPLSCSSTGPQDVQKGHCGPPNDGNG